MIDRTKPILIEGKKYSVVPRYNDWDTNKKWPDYPEIETVTFIYDEEPLTISGAERWLLKNHPDYYFGCGIYQKNVKSGDFMFNAVVGYYELEYKTTDRDEILAKICKEKGLDYTPAPPIIYNSGNKEYVLTKSGRETIDLYITELLSNREKVIEAKLDTVADTKPPTEEELFEAVISFGFDDSGEAFNSYPISDNTDMDYPCLLKLGRDVEEKVLEKDNIELDLDDMSR